MTAQQYIEKYVHLIEDERWDVFWDGLWYNCNHAETNKILDILESIGISRESSYQMREDLFKFWLNLNLKTVPDRKDVAIFLYSDMKTHFGLNEDEVYDLFIQEIENHSDRLYLDDEDQEIRKKVIK